MKTLARLLTLAWLALSPIGQAQQYIGPTQTLPAGCNSTNFLRGDNSCQPVGGGTGTVTSVAETVPAGFSITGSPITSSGTLAIAFASGQTANSFLATPNGSTGALSLRTITLADLPTIPSTQISGLLLAAQEPAHTGDMTNTAGSLATTVKQLHPTVTAITNASSPYSVAAGDSMITCDATAGAVVINLPAATATFREISFKKLDSSGNACIPTRAGSDLIDGATTISITSQYAAAKVQDTASAVWSRTHINQLVGDANGASSANTVTKINGITPGGTCTNQAVTSVSSSAVPACTTLTSAYVDTSIALTGTDINTSGQVTATHLSGPLPATQGGTGQTTITLGDLLYGSASNVLSKLAGNTTSAKQFLTQTGTGTVSAAPAWGALASGDIPALGGNPSVTVGTTATNGSATTYLRSDAAPAINLGMTPTWTAAHTFSASPTFSAGFSSGGTGTWGSWTITTGGTASLLRVLLNTGVYIAGTKFTTSGCSISSTTGGATAGTFTLGANSCSAVVTFGSGTLTAANGWTCQAHDRTAPTILIGGESSTTTSTATFTIPAGAGATDVISFSCMAY